MRRLRFLPLLFILFFCISNSVKADDAVISATGDTSQKPNGKRIRRQLNLIIGLQHDEEIKLPQKELVIKGRYNVNDPPFRIERMAGTDYFRLTPLKAGSGIMTLNDKETGQILAEIRYDVRDDAIERSMREIQSLLADIEGIEYKLINPTTGNNLPTILLDGYVLLPRDLIRISHVLNNYPSAKSLVTLSPIARQKIAEFITRDVNNPEVKITAVGNFIKLEGQVNDDAEKARIKNIVSLYLPDIVQDKPAQISPDITTISTRKAGGTGEEQIIDLITVRPREEKVEPPPKMIQVVVHFVKFTDGYSKAFNFSFQPAVSTQAGVNGAPNAGNSASTFDSTINLLSNLLPKLQWARAHGFAKVLDTASVLIQDKTFGVINRTTSSLIQQIGANGQTAQTPTPSAGVSLSVKPTIKSERSGLVELSNLQVQVSGSNGKIEFSTLTAVNTTISVRDRQSAAFGGLIKKSTESTYGAPTNERAIITFNAKKEYVRDNSQFVVFVTPIIKASASTGVEQVKKKFRLRD
jgi:pilus assembly protein CpaC